MCFVYFKCLRTLNYNISRLSRFIHGWYIEFIVRCVINRVVCFTHAVMRIYGYVGNKCARAPLASKRQRDWATCVGSLGIRCSETYQLLLLLNVPLLN